MPGRWIGEGDDDHERRLAILEDAMFDTETGITVKMARYEASNKVWAIVLATIVSIAFGAAQSWFTKPTTNDQVIEAVQDLQQELHRINAGREARE